MYRMFCESYRNYQSNYLAAEDKDYRGKLAAPIELLVDLDRYRKEMLSNSMLFMKLNDLLTYLKHNEDRYPKVKAFLWTLESRGIKGCSYGVSGPEELEEQTKLVNMFLNLLYWENNIH